MPANTPPDRDHLRVSPVPASVIWPLTSDLLDTDGGNALSGPPTNPTPAVGSSGFVCNGTDTRLSAALPEWAQDAREYLSLHVVVKPPAALDSENANWREVACGVTTTTGDTPKLELAMLKDSTYNLPVMALRTYNGSSVQVYKLNRIGWRFHFRIPELINSNTALQSLCFLDATTMLIAVKIPNVIYRVDLTTGEYTGRAESTTYNTINSIHAAPDGTVWCQCQVGGVDQRKQIDLDASFSTGEITESGSWNTGDVPTSSIAFATVGGTEYVLLSQYLTSGTPRCYIFLRSQMSGPVNQVNRAKRFKEPLGAQDLAFNPVDGRIYFSCWGSASIIGYDLATILAGPDDATPTGATTFVAPCSIPQGIDFSPVDGRAYVAAEYNISNQDRGAVWSSALSGTEENSYLFDYVGGAIEARLNGRLLQSFGQNPGVTPQKITVGASPTAVSGQTGFLSSGGTVRSLAIKNVPFTEEELQELA